MYRVVFCGEVTSGFEPAVVFKAATQRMKASPEQMLKVFSGRKVVLKKGMSQKEGAYYVAELQKIGMHVALEYEPETSLEAQERQIAAGRPSGEKPSAHSPKNKDDEWAIASIHEPSLKYVYGNEMHSSSEDTDVNIPPYQHLFLA